MFVELPYTNFHELNLDWIIQKLNETVQTVETFEQQLPETIREIVEQTLINMSMDYRPATEAIVFEFVESE